MTEDKHRERMDPAKRLAELRAGGSDKPAPDAEDVVEEEIVDERQSFSILSADRQHKLMVELRFKTGNARAFAYSYLVSIDFDPSQGIRMDFSGYEVAIAGRNLNPLFAGLCASGSRSLSNATNSIPRRRSPRTQP